MKTNFLRFSWQYLTQKLRVERFTGKISSNPKLVRILNVVLPASMMLAVLFGGAVLAWQIASFAKEGEVSIVLPKASPVTTDDFVVEVKFVAALARNPLNLVFKLDGRVINAKVTGSFEKDEVQKYVFTSGVNGANVFDHNVLRPGDHTLRVEARTGDKVGKTAANQDEPDIDVAQVNFKVGNVKNIVATGEPDKTIPASDLDQPTPARNALQPKSESLASLLMPKALAHSGDGKRHGDLNVHAPPKTQVTVDPVAPSLGGCHGGNGNTRQADDAGIARFSDCGVTNNCTDPNPLAGCNNASYKVTLGDTPAGWTLQDVHERNVNVRWAATATINFQYAVSAAPDPPAAPADPGPAAPQDAQPAPVAASYDYQPDDGPLIALTKLTATTAEVAVFGYQLKNNLPANYIKEVSADVDGQRVSTRTDFNNHASHAPVTLSLPNLNDGQPHSLRLRVVNMKDIANYLDVCVTTATANCSGASVPAGVVDGGDGKVQVTTYAYDQAIGSKERIGSTQLEIQAKDHPVDQVVNNKLLNCNPYAKTTNATKSSDSYGQAHFDGCWTSSDGSQSYQLKKIEPPAGYTFRGIHLSSAPGESLGPDAQFTVKAGQETAVEIWLTPPADPEDPTDDLSGSGQKPPAPANFQASETSPGTVNMTWDSVNGVSGYIIEKFDPESTDPDSAWQEVCDNSDTVDTSTDSESEANTSGEEPAKIIPLTSCEDSAAGINVHKVYRVAAYNSSEDDSVKSDYVQTEITTAPLAMPSNLKITETGPTIIRLEWQAAATAVSGYSIQKSADGVTWEEIGTNEGNNETAYIDEGEGIKYSTRYFYRVASTDGNENYSAFAASEITTAPLAAPSGLKITETGPAVVQLDWQPAADNDDVVYVVERSTDQSNWTKLKEDLSDPAYTDLEGLHATHYFYRVAAKKENATSAYIKGDITTSVFVPNINVAGVSVTNEEDASAENNGDDDQAQQSDDGEIPPDELDKLLEPDEFEGKQISDESGDSDMEAFIPEDALSEPAECDIMEVDGASDDLPDDLQLADEPDALVCKTANGSIATSFKKPVIIVFKTKSDKEKDRRIFSLTAARVLGSKVKSGGGSGAGGRIVTATKRPGVFALLEPAEKKRFSPILIVGGALAVMIGAAVGSVAIRYRLESRFSAPPDPDI